MDGRQHVSNAGSGLDKPAFGAEEMNPLSGPRHLASETQKPTAGELPGTGTAGSTPSLAPELVSDSATDTGPLRVEAAPAKPARVVPSGSLLYIRQFHHRPEQGPSDRARVLRSQQRVLDALLDAKPKAVFMEWLHDDKRVGPLSIVREMTVKAFKGYVPGQPLSDDQAWCFGPKGALNAAEVYAFVNSGTVELDR